MLKKLMEAARKEDWETVEALIPKACKKADIVNWAFERGLNNPNDNIRDLAASILEKAEIGDDTFRSMRQKLYGVMTSDSNQYARYRSAFALAGHGPGDYKNRVLITLKEASRDPDVKGIASKYIKKLEK